MLACLGLRPAPDPAWEVGETDRSWLLSILVVCVLLTLSSGVSFGQGSRMREPLELIIPLLAAGGLLRLVEVFRHALSILSEKQFSRSEGRS